MKAVSGYVDIIAFQDGHVTYEELGPAMALNKRLADKYGIELWTNSETFDRDMPIRFLPIKWEKLRYKLKKAEEADLLDDYGLYMNIADAIDSQGKKETSNHIITETEWKMLTRRYCL